MLDLFWPSGGIAGVRRLGKEPLGYIAAAGALIATLVSLIWVDDSTDFAGLVDVDDYTTLFRVFFGLIGVFACLASAKYVKGAPLEITSESKPASPRAFSVSACRRSR
jgi:hypothetical protein